MLNRLANPVSNLSPLPMLPSDVATRWYAVYTRPRHEKAVADGLRSKSIEVFLPTVVTESRWKDRIVRIESPLFPGYVFTRIHLGERGKVLRVFGVVRMLSSHGAPASIDDAELESVRLCVEHGVRLEVGPFLKVGQRVRVRAGLLEGVEGVIARRKDSRSLIVPVSLIHQSVAVEVDAGLLEPLGSSAVASRAVGSGLIERGRRGNAAGPMHMANGHDHDVASMYRA
ncbi:UpxY family transcription antiterminator [Edaphobacter acidisoli]|nr:UpxY family transcription antiterminator [Edaphobacter acidisoli]